MKKIFLFTIALVFISIGVKAQSAELIIGNWVFSQVSPDETQDSSSLEFANSLFSETQMDFLEDGTYYISGMDKEEEGTYTISGKKLMLKDLDGESSEMEIITLNQEQLILKIGKVTIILSPFIEEDIDE